MRRGLALDRSSRGSCHRDVWHKGGRAPGRGPAAVPRRRRLKSYEKLSHLRARGAEYWPWTRLLPQPATRSLLQIIAIQYVIPGDSRGGQFTAMLVPEQRN